MADVVNIDKSVEAIADVIDFNEYKDRKKLEKEKCDHGLSFDIDVAERLSTQEVREIFPRLEGLCPKGCGFNGIAYVSKAHFVYGDW